MGDMADYYNELQEEGGRYFPGGGRATYSSPRRPAPLTCGHCGKGCTWGKDAGGKWKLHDWNGVHNCRASVATADDFDDVS